VLIIVVILIHYYCSRVCIN